MAFDSERTRLAASAAAIERLLADRPRATRVWLKEVQRYYDIYGAVLSHLRTAEPELFDGTPDHPPVLDTQEPPDAQQGPRVWIREVQSLLRDIKHCLDLLPVPTVQVALTVTREGVFFAGQRTDAMKAILDIVGLARAKLEIIDGYIDIGMLSLFTRDPKLQVEVLTYPLDGPTTQAFTAVAKGKQLRIRTSKDFHDRFICVDNGDVYHFGASIKDAGGRGFMFSRVEEPLVLAALRSEWARVWSAALVVV